MGKPCRKGATGALENSSRKCVRDGMQKATEKTSRTRI
ncbi:hypothetical protein PA8380_59320 [Pseudomonas aeruginosa]|nr:hypothetical protein PA8380_59320 [Pseudomonas aeruginosa]GAA20288.1 hypothetical protein NCGM1179_5150 [Pseudomonas aeruginosa NCMG1179]